MIFYFKKNFIKKFKKLPQDAKIKFNKQIEIFSKDPFSVALNNHVLHGVYFGYRSINIGGNLRAIYKIQNENIALFVDIDNHSNLYK